MSREELQAQIEEAKARLNVKDEAPVEEHKEEQVDVNTDVKNEASEDPYLEEAIKMGYNPNYEGANKKTPEQFVKDGSFFRKIDSLNKRIEQMSTVIQDLDSHNKKVAQAAYEKGLKEALARRAQAVRESDLDAFNEAELELKNLREQQVPKVEQPVNQSSPPNPSEDMKVWAKENENWFNSQNPRLVREADGLYVLEKEENPNLSDREILQRVKDAIVRLHPERFENPNKERAPSVGKSSITSSKASSYESKLTDRQLNLLKQAQRAGSKITAEDYAKQLKMIGELKDE